VTDIFVSYTSSDRDWAFWIAKELETLSHVARVHEWEISAGGNIPAWMEQRHDQADHVLLVVSQNYLAKDYSKWERLAAEWAAVSMRPNFAWPVFIEPCEAPTLLAPFKRCDLYGLSEADARERVLAYVTPATKPPGAVAFPGGANPRPTGKVPVEAHYFPGLLSNVPIRVPRHFLGRDEAIAAIESALELRAGRVSVVALVGLRGVGKSTLAAAYSEMRRTNCLATWWVRAETPDMMRADLVALGVRLGWVGANTKEADAFEIVRDRLKGEGKEVLLVFDNAIDAKSVRPYLPSAGAARVLVTSNAQAWRGIAEVIKIGLWQKNVGADFLIARTGRAEERAEAGALSEALGGLPLAHEQAGAYCERLEVSLAEYRRRFQGAPQPLLDAAKDASPDYHGGLTVAKAFALAIDQAAKLHPAAEPLIAYAALLAPEPIPLFLFAEAREKFDEPFASQISGDGLDEAVAALRAFALIDREAIPDERNPSTATDTIRLHRLVRLAAAARWHGEGLALARRALIEAMTEVFPSNVFSDPRVWPRARRLDPLAFALVGLDDATAVETDATAAKLLDRLASYRQGAFAAYDEARGLFERALAIRMRTLGQMDPGVADTLNNLALLLRMQGDLEGSLPLGQRALAIYREAFGPEHPDTAMAVENLASLEKDRGDLSSSRDLYERALVIRERDLAADPSGAARCLNNLALVMQRQGDIQAARPLFTRALAILTESLGPDHPFSHRVRRNLAELRLTEGFPQEALEAARTALAGHERTYGLGHPTTRDSARTVIAALEALGDFVEAASIRARLRLPDCTP
jgi:tetratricopeptide (TPR) repeat protein